MSEPAPTPARRGFLNELGLHRPEIRAWVMYDWANSVFMTTIIQVFPIYFTNVAASQFPKEVASERFALATTIAMMTVAVLAPILGAIADYAGAKKKMLGWSLGIGVIATGALYLVGQGDWILGSALFIVGNIAVTASFVFYESLLPHIASEDEIDRVSTAGYALGYLGGGLLLAINLWWIQKPETFGMPDAGFATRLSFLSAALWWGAFSIPLFLKVPEPPRRMEVDETPGGNAVAVAFTRLGETLKELRGYRQAFVLLLAFLFYNDGIQTIIRMATSYGTEIGIAASSLIAAILMVQFVGVPFAFLFGWLAGKLGVKKALFIPVAIYVIIPVLGYRMTTARDFFVLAFLVATVQGGSQALSRSLFATMIPKHKSGEFFGFFGVFEKFAGVLGPGVFYAFIKMTGSSRPAILAIIVFFVLGGFLLTLVDVEKGRAAAREAEEALLRRPA
jgi:UMF1 family MFS transporter